MPHVKGNKFKPKLPEPPPAPEPAAAVEATGQQQQGGKKKKKPKRAQAAGGPAGAADVAVEAAAPAPATVDAAAGSRPAKKQRRQAPQPVLPAVPTVVAPAPRPGAAPAEAAAAATSNWAALKAAMDAAKQQQPSRPWWGKKAKGADGQAGDGAVQAAVPANRPQSIGSDTSATKVVAIDCEMVGVGPGGQRSALARVCVVNSAGNVLVDRFVRPKEKVTDFRTKVSGVRPINLRDAPPFDEVQRQVSDLLKGRIVVGHALENDMEALLLGHRRKDVRDTAKYPPLMKAQARSGKLKPRALRHLASEQLGLTIQEGEHSPVDDARAALYLYLKHRKEWERWVQQGAKPHQHPAMVAAAAAGGGMGGKAGTARKQLSLEELAKNDYMADL